VFGKPGFFVVDGWLSDPNAERRLNLYPNCEDARWLGRRMGVAPGQKRLKARAVKTAGPSADV